MELDNRQYGVGEKLFVHRYRWSHDKRRSKLKKKLKMGQVEMIEQTRDGFLYKVIK